MKTLKNFLLQLIVTVLIWKTSLCCVWSFWLWDDPEKCRAGSAFIFRHVTSYPCHSESHIYILHAYSSFRAAPSSSPGSLPCSQLPPSLHSVSSALCQIILEIIHPHNHPSPTPRGPAWWNHFLTRCFPSAFSASVKRHRGRIRKHGSRED